VEAAVKNCHECQIGKKVRKKYGDLPEKLTEIPIAWNRVDVDLIGPLTVKTPSGNKEYNIQKRAAVYHRLVLAASFFELLVGIWLSVSTLAMPSFEEDNNINTSTSTSTDVPYYLLWSKGSRSTCQLQGIFIQLSTTSPLYTATITLYYLFTVHYSWKEHNFSGIITGMNALGISRYLHRAALLILVFGRRAQRNQKTLRFARVA
jgi:hypothetical protein